MRRPTRPWLAAALGGAALIAAGLGPAGAAREVEIERIPDPVEGVAPADEAAEAAEGLPEIQYDPATLPTPVRRLREQLIEAARTGDVEKLRPILEANPFEPVFSFGDPADPIAFLREQSGDGEGRETLAILQEVLEAGFVHVDAGTDEEMYVWPWFARYPVEGLSGPQMVELFHLITAGDYEDMLAFGAYIFYRVGITPDGSWAYFVAGD
jgi:hypothetical protein